jgi:hypothetical protein
MGQTRPSPARSQVESPAIWSATARVACTCAIATSSAADLLALPDVPVIRQFRVVYSDDDRSVEASVLVKGSHLYELLYRQSV